MPELAAKSKVAGELDVDPGVCIPVFSHPMNISEVDWETRKSNMIDRDF